MEPELRPAWDTAPHPQRLAPGHARRDEILARHEAAVAARQPVYADPTSGLSVFTAVFLARRGYCCNSGCRHCPYVSVT